MLTALEALQNIAQTADVDNGTTIRGFIAIADKDSFEVSIIFLQQTKEYLTLSWIG